MQVSSDFSIVYVITSDGKDVFADMALVSMLSVRISNPGRKIVALCDAPSAGALRRANHRIVKLCDELISVETPAGEPTFRNRWIKTRVGRLVSGAVLYLDADILVRKELNGLAYVARGIGGTANFNGANLEAQLWRGERDLLVRLGWPTSFDPAYINGGLIYSDAEKQSKALWETWPLFYDESVRNTGTPRDQVTLNAAIAMNRIAITELSSCWNAQVLASPEVAFDAAVWHFYSSMEDTSRTVFTDLVQGARTLSPERLKCAVASAVKRRIPWTLETTPYLVEKSLLKAYRDGKKLKWSELIFFLYLCGSRKNYFLAACAGAGLNYQTAERLMKKIVKIKRCLYIKKIKNKK